METNFLLGRIRAAAKTGDYLCVRRSPARLERISKPLLPSPDGRQIPRNPALWRTRLRGEQVLKCPLGVKTQTSLDDLLARVNAPRQ